MKEPKRRPSLSGAVLIMILTVMFVLIILLTATLTTVTTANQRIYTKFEENQAYYTARSALDVFTHNMLDDKAYYSYDDSGKREYIYGNSSDASQDDAYMKQGLGLQLDLYSITSQDGMNITQAALNTSASSITVDADRKDEHLNYFGTKPTVGAPTTVGADINEVWYEIELPAVSGKESSGTAHDFGKMSDGRKAKIKVEILDRSYDMGTYSFTAGAHSGTDIKTYLDTLSDDDLKDFFDNMTSNEEQDVAMAIIMGNRKKDTMRIKITAIAEFDGVEGTAVLIFDSNEPPVNNSSRAITAFGGTGSDNMSILGGMSAENTINWGSNDGFIYGPVYVEQDFLMASNGPKIYLNSGENLVVGGDMQLANDGHFKVTNKTNPLVVDDENAPFVYIGGELKIVSDIQNPFMNMDVIAETLTANAKLTLDSSCTIYCKSFTSNCGSNSEYNGDIYVDGNVYIYGDNNTKVVYDNSVSPPVPTSVVHGGSGTIHYTGQIIDGNTGTDVSSFATSGFMHETTGFWTNIPEVSEITDNNPSDSDNTKIEFQLPGRTSKKQIETHVQNFDEYYVKDSDGKRVMITVTDSVTGSPYTTPEVKSAQVMADIDTMSDKTLPLTAANTGITDNLSDLAPTSSGGNFYGTYFNRVLNTGGGDVKAIWDFDNQNIYIRGGGTVVLQLRSSSYSNNNLILVDDDTTLKIVGDVDATATSWSDFGKLEVYNQTTYGAAKGNDAGEGTASLKVGSLSGNGIKVPKIYYYFTGSEFNVQNDCRLTGYIYAPDTNLVAPSAGSMATSLEYNGVTTTATPVCIVGSALVKGATLPNNTGVAYINPDLDDDTPGDPIHNWQTYQYVRN